MSSVDSALPQTLQWSINVWKMDPFALPRLSGIRVGGLLAIVCLLHCNSKVWKRKKEALRWGTWLEKCKSSCAKACFQVPPVSNYQSRFFAKSERCYVMKWRSEAINVRTSLDQKTDFNLDERKGIRDVVWKIEK